MSRNPRDGKAGQAYAAIKKEPPEPLHGREPAAGAKPNAASFRYSTPCVVVINGVKYSGELFRQFALAREGQWLRIEGNRGGTMTVFSVTDTLEKTFDLLCGKAGR